MTEREKIINIVEQNKYCDVNTAPNCRECKYGKELENYKDMGVSYKTALRWERRKKPIKGSAAVLLSLLNDNDELVEKVYCVKNSKGLEQIEEDKGE